MESNSNTLLNVLVRFCKVAPLGSSLHQIRELQPWSMEYGVWSMEYGVWSMEYVGVNIKVESLQVEQQIVHKYTIIPEINAVSY